MLEVCFIMSYEKFVGNLAFALGGGRLFGRSIGRLCNAS